MHMDHVLFLFCGRRCDPIKAILKEPDGIVLIYKRLTAQGRYPWPRDKSEVRNLDEELEKLAPWNKEVKTFLETRAMEED